MTDGQSTRGPAGSDVPFGGEFRGPVHVIPVRVYFEDTDFSGVVYHASYVRFLERGRSDCLRLAGVHHTELWEREEPLAFALLHMEMTFHKPARIDDVLEVHSLYSRVAGARIEVSQRILRGQDVLVSAQVQAACINPQGRPRRLPRDVVEMMAPYLADPGEA